MQLDFYLGRIRRAANDPDILRVDNCSEVDVAGGFYQQDGKNFDDCCDLQSQDAPECQTAFECQTDCKIGIGIFVFFGAPWACIFVYFLARCANACYKKCRQIVPFCCQRPSACCERQTSIRNDNNATRYSTERPNISTISDNIRQPPRPIATAPPPSTSSSSTPPSWEIDIDQFPRLKASKDQCTGRRKYNTKEIFF